MIGMYVIIGVAVLVAGFAIGIFTIVSIGTCREGAYLSRGADHRPQGRQQPGQGQSAARAFHGHYARTPQVDHRGAHQRDNLRVLTGGGRQS